MYEANPFGKSFLAVAEIDGKWMGTISGIPCDIVRPDGRTVTAYQIGDFMVDPAVQGRGLGHRLLSNLTEILRDGKAPIFTFPNRNSVGIFLRQGYHQLRSIPSVIFPTMVAALVDRLGFREPIRRRNASVEEACSVADLLHEKPSSMVKLAKNGAYVRWRYSKIRDAGNYCFCVLEDSNTGIKCLVVWCRFVFRRISFQIVVDIIGVEEPRSPLGRVAWPALKEGILIGFNNVERQSLRVRTPLSIRVPISLDPRPARLLVPPDDDASSSLFSKCQFTTGDWIGF